MTKFLTKAALAATVATGLFAAPAMASDTKPFTATARIVSPLTLTLAPGGLNFGTITILPTLAPAGEDVVVGRAGLGGGADACGPNLQCTAPSPASFSVTGSIGQGLNVTYGMSANAGFLMNGAASVPFSFNGPSTVSLAGAGPGAGTASFEVGGTITVSPTTVDGTYTNTVDVTVEYS